MRLLSFSWGNLSESRDPVSQYPAFLLRFGGDAAGWLMGKVDSLMKKKRTLLPVFLLVGGLLLLLAGRIGLRVSARAAGGEEKAFVTAAIRKILSGMPLEGKEEAVKAEMIYRYLCENYWITEVSDTGMEEDKLLYEVLTEGVASDRGCAVLTGRLMAAAGLEEMVVSGGGHYWNLVRIGSCYYHLDVAMGGKKVEEAEQFFLKGDEGYEYAGRMDARFWQPGFREAVPISKTDYPIAMTGFGKAEVTAMPTEVPEPTATPKPTKTPKPTATPKPTKTPKPTATPKPTKTPKPTATPKPTKTPKPTATPKPTKTPKPSPTPAHVHEWASSYTVDREPTCTRKGSKSIYCLTCGKRQPGSSISIDAKGHQWSAWRVTKEPTVLEKGLEEHSCKACNITKSRKMAKREAVLKLSVTEYSMIKGSSTRQIYVTAMGHGDYVKEIKAKESFLSVSDLDPAQGTFRIRALKKGKTTLTVRLASNKTQKVVITILPLPTQKVFLAEKTLTLYADKNQERHTFQLEPILYPQNSDEKVDFASSDSSVVRVTRKGKVTAVRKGTAEITVTSGKASCVCRVTVR